MGQSNMPLKPRSLKIRKKQAKQDSTVDLKAIEHLIESRVEPLQNQIKILQTNAITAMVIFGDIRNSVLLAGVSQSSTKQRLEELIDNIDAATTNIQEFIGAPQKILNENYVEPHTAEEAATALDEAARRLIRQGGWEDSTEADDIIENVSEEVDEGEVDEGYVAGPDEFAEADAYEDTVRQNRRRRTYRRG